MSKSKLITFKSLTKSVKLKIKEKIVNKRQNCKSKGGKRSNDTIT